uniref:FtsX-like permease family protein n=1 Tax=uncultured Arcanobacterium sp. TaxID=487520 RepID=UPI002626CAF3
LGLVLIFWARGRIREIGILLALGKSKLNILVQFIIEIALLGALSALLALLIGHFLSSSLSTALLARSGDATLAALSAESGGILSTLAALAGGYSIIFISLSAALFPIFRKTPKSILSQMS